MEFAKWQLKRRTHSLTSTIESWTTESKNNQSKTNQSKTNECKTNRPRISEYWSRSCTKAGKRAAAPVCLCARTHHSAPNEIHPA
jgi:hypothetical protein